LTAARFSSLRDYVDLSGSIFSLYWFLFSFFLFVRIDTCSNKLFMTDLTNRYMSLHRTHWLLADVSWLIAISTTHLVKQTGKEIRANKGYFPSVSFLISRFKQQESFVRKLMLYWYNFIFVVNGAGNSFKIIYL